MPSQVKVLTLANCKFGYFCTMRWLDKNDLPTGQQDHYYRLEDLNGRPLEEGPYAPLLQNVRKEDEYPQEGLFSPYQFPR